MVDEGRFPDAAERQLMVAAFVQGLKTNLDEEDNRSDWESDVSGSDFGSPTVIGR